MSIAGGLYRAYEIAADAGCDCVQVFVKNQRQWRAAPLRDEDIAAWQATGRRTGITPAVAHATYLINLASADDTIYARSVEALADELVRCMQLGIRGLVMHPGAHMGAGVDVGCRRVAAALRVVRDMVGPGGAEVWLEITAGQGSCLGHRFEEIRDILACLANPSAVGVCFDTCHAVAAGYRLDTPERFADVFEQFDRTIGLDRLRCFHLNDSLREPGSRVDRHTHIGKGHVGRCAFRSILQDQRFANLPMILETPKGKDERGRDLDRMNLAALRRLARPAR